MIVAGLSAALQADFVARTLQPLLCPAGSTAEIITYQTTSRDEFGNEQPATAYEMQCVDSSGRIVRPPSPDFAFYWIGFLALGSLLVSGLLGLLLAAPVGAFMTRRVQRSQKAGTA